MINNCYKGNLLPQKHNLNRSRIHLQNWQIRPPFNQCCAGSSSLIAIFATKKFGWNFISKSLFILLFFIPTRKNQLTASKKSELLTLNCKIEDALQKFGFVSYNFGEGFLFGMLKPSLTIHSSLILCKDYVSPGFLMLP